MVIEDLPVERIKTEIMEDELVTIPISEGNVLETRQPDESIHSTTRQSVRTGHPSSDEGLGCVPERTVATPASRITTESTATALAVTRIPEGNVTVTGYQNQSNTEQTSLAGQPSSDFGLGGLFIGCVPERTVAAPASTITTESTATALAVTRIPEGNVTVTGYQNQSNTEQTSLAGQPSSDFGISTRIISKRMVAVPEQQNEPIDFSLRRDFHTVGQPIDYSSRRDFHTGQPIDYSKRRDFHTGQPSSCLSRFTGCVPERTLAAPASRITTESTAAASAVTRIPEGNVAVTGYQNQSNTKQTSHAGQPSSDFGRFTGCVPERTVAAPASRITTESTAAALAVTRSPGRIAAVTGYQNLSNTKQTSHAGQPSSDFGRPRNVSEEHEHISTFDYETRTISERTEIVWGRRYKSVVFHLLDSCSYHNQFISEESADAVMTSGGPVAGAEQQNQYTPRQTLRTGQPSSDLRPRRHRRHRRRHRRPYSTGSSSHPRAPTMSSRRVSERQPPSDLPDLSEYGLHPPDAPVILADNCDACCGHDEPRHEIIY